MTFPFQYINITENARHTEFVLIFQITAVTPFQHQHMNTVLSVVQKIRYVKLGGAMADLAVPDKLPIDIQK